VFMDKRIAAMSAVLSVAAFAGCAGLKAEDVKVYRPAQLKQGLVLYRSFLPLAAAFARFCFTLSFTIRLIRP